jgi:uncharacterized protein
LTITMHESSVGVFSLYLGNLSDILDLAAADAAARKIDPQLLLRSRTAPDMFDVSRQVLEAIRHAIGTLARVATPRWPRLCDLVEEPAAIRPMSKLAVGANVSKRTHHMQA